MVMKDGLPISLELYLFINSFTTAIVVGGMSIITCGIAVDLGYITQFYCQYDLHKLKEDKKSPVTVKSFTDERNIPITIPFNDSRCYRNS